ncbi:MAG: hypothetical protein ACLFSU_01390 [Acholeplasmataceae bacterium]
MGRIVCGVNRTKKMKRGMGMRKLMISLVLLAAIVMVSSCVEITEVESIELDWVPQEWYDISGSNINLEDKELTVNYDDGESDTITLDTTGVSLSGSGVDGTSMRLDRVGKFDVTVAFEGASLTFEYYVDDEDFVQAINSIEKIGNFKGEEDDTDTFVGYLSSLNLSTYGLEIWYDEVYEGVDGVDNSDVRGVEKDVIATRENGYGGEFDNAYQVQQVILAAVSHRMATRDGRLYVEEDIIQVIQEIEEEEIEEEEFEPIDWDLLVFNLISVYEGNVMTHVANTDKAGNNLTSEFLVGYYRSLFEGPIYGSDTIEIEVDENTYIATNFPGIFEIGSDLEFAEFMHEYFYEDNKGGYDPDESPALRIPGYSEIAEAINHYLITLKDDDNNNYFVELDKNE